MDTSNDNRPVTQKELDAALADQEHRLFWLLWNICKYWNLPHNDPRRVASSRAIFLRFLVSPAVVIGGTASILGWLMFYEAHQSNAILSAQTEVMRRQLQQDRENGEKVSLSVERDLLMQLLMQADELACINESTTHANAIILERAAEIESRISHIVSATEYHALASLGAIVWEFSRLEHYCNRALEVSTTTWEKQLSYQQLASAHFEHSDRTSDASVAKGREFFQTAEELIVSEPVSKRRDRALGAIYELWSSQELFGGNAEESNKRREQAIEAWSTLSEAERAALSKALDQHLQQTRNGTRPRSPCLQREPIPAQLPEKDMTLIPLSARMGSTSQSVLILQRDNSQRP